jgi:hypothetical protein
MATSPTVLPLLYLISEQLRDTQLSVSGVGGGGVYKLPDPRRTGWRDGNPHI